MNYGVYTKMSLPFNIAPNNDKEKQDINSICEALSCSSKATEKIEVKVGIYGTISLILCNKCINIFQKQQKNVD